MTQQFDGETGWPRDFDKREIIRQGYEQLSRSTRSRRLKSLDGWNAKRENNGVACGPRELRLTDQGRFRRPCVAVYRLLSRDFNACNNSV